MTARPAGPDGDGRKPDDEKESRAWPWVVAVLIVLLVIAGGGVTAYLLTRPTKVIVPNVVDESQQSATATLSELWLHAERHQRDLAGDGRDGAPSEPESGDEGQQGLDGHAHRLAGARATSASHRSAAISQKQAQTAITNAGPEDLDDRQRELERGSEGRPRRGPRRRPAPLSRPAPRSPSTSPPGRRPWPCPASRATRRPLRRTR